MPGRKITKSKDRMNTVKEYTRRPWSRDARTTAVKELPSAPGWFLRGYEALVDVSYRAASPSMRDCQELDSFISTDNVCIKSDIKTVGRTIRLTTELSVSILQ